MKWGFGRWMGKNVDPTRAGLAAQIPQINMKRYDFL
jgi:hypothetical protein